MQPQLSGSTSALSVFLFYVVLPCLPFSSSSSSALSSPHISYLIAVTHAYGLSSCYVLLLCFCLLCLICLSRLSSRFSANVLLFSYFLILSYTFFHAVPHHHLYPITILSLGFFRRCLLQSIFLPLSGPFWLSFCFRQDLSFVFTLSHLLLTV